MDEIDSGLDFHPVKCSAAKNVLVRGREAANHGEGKLAQDSRCQMANAPSGRP